MYACCVGTRFITEADAWLMAADSAGYFGLPGGQTVLIGSRIQV